MTREPVIIVGTVAAVSTCAGALIGRRWSLRAERCAELGRARFVHGHTVGHISPEYQSWLSMRHRCEHPADASWRYYGGRGIRVDPRWQSFSAFLKDMGPRPGGHTLDRRDSNGHYCPQNCKWSTAIEQARGRRPRGSGFAPVPPSPWADELADA